MKYDKPYLCDYLGFFIEPNKDYPAFRSKSYSLAFHPRNGFIRDPVLSREELKGLADFIYKYLEQN